MHELRFGEQGPLTEQDWAEVVDGEPQPFGPGGEGIVWAPKDRHVTFRAADGRLLGAAGALVAPVRVGAGVSFDVVGIGSVIVTRTLRGRGLMRMLVEALLDLAAGMGPDRAMLFCAPGLVRVYERFGFAEIDAPVSVDQPQGRIEMQEPSMWRPLRQDAVWPPGPVEVEGLPF